MNPDDNSYSAQSQKDQIDDGQVKYNQDTYSDPMNTGVGTDSSLDPGGVTSATNANQGNPGQSPNDMSFGLDTGDQQQEDVDEKSDYKTTQGFPEITPNDKDGVNPDIVKGIAGEDNISTSQTQNYKIPNLDEGNIEEDQVDLGENSVPSMGSNDDDQGSDKDDTEELISGDAIYDGVELGQVNDQDKQRNDTQNNQDIGFSITDKEPEMSTNDEGELDDDTTGRRNEL